MNVAANGLRFSYRLNGSGETSVVFIHGLGGSAQATYGPVVQRLAGELQLLSFDNRGVGESDKPAGAYSLSDFARDTHEVMRAVGIDRAHIVGHSLGGMIAQQFALDYPDAALSLVLADCPGELSDAARASFEQRASAVEQGGTAAIVDGVIKNGIGVQAKERYPEAVEAFRQSLLASPAGPYAASARAAATLALLPRLSAYRQPVLVLRGDQDGGVPLEAARALAGAFPEGRFEEIPESGHNSPFENPDVFARLVGEFLRETAGVARG